LVATTVELIELIELIRLNGLIRLIVVVRWRLADCVCLVANHLYQLRVVVRMQSRAQAGIAVATVVAGQHCLHRLLYRFFFALRTPACHNQNPFA